MLPSYSLPTSPSSCFLLSLAPPLPSLQSFPSSSSCSPSSSPHSFGIRTQPSSFLTSYFLFSLSKILLLSRPSCGNRTKFAYILIFGISTVSVPNPFPPPLFFKQFLIVTLFFKQFLIVPLFFKQFLPPVLSLFSLNSNSTLCETCPIRSNSLRSRRMLLLVPCVNILFLAVRTLPSLLALTLLMSWAL